MHKKNQSFFDMLKKEKLTTFVIYNNLQSNSAEYSLSKDWSTKTIWMGKDSTNLLKKSKSFNQEEILNIITKYSLKYYLDEILGLMKNGKHKKLLFLYDPKNDVRCVLSCHNTNKKYVVGGLRRALAARSEYSVISNALSLSKGMSYRCAVADLPCSGVSLIVHNASPEKEESAFFGFIAYVIEEYEIFLAPESGFSKKEIIAIKEHTSRCVTDESTSGNAISIVAMNSVYTTIKETLKYRYPENKSIKGKTIAIQGLGVIGASLAQKLLKEGALLIIADIDHKKVESFLSTCKSTKNITVEEFHSIEVQMGHVFAPCSLGGVIDRDSVSSLDYHIIAGGANNVLATPVLEEEIEIANLLMKKEIIYIPDWISNFGGAMYGVSLFMNENEEYNLVQKQVDKILRKTIKSLLKTSAKEKISPLEIAYQKFEPKIY